MDNLGNFLSTIRNRNQLLYYTGCFCLFAAAICAILVMITNTTVLGISAWWKPMKFFLSVVALFWSMAWFMKYLDKPKTVRWYSWMLVLVMTYELSYITIRAGMGKLSHFGVATPLEGILFGLMGVFVVLATLWTGYIGILFALKRLPTISSVYQLGIILGIFFFVLFAFEGNFMISQFGHTVGGPDGGEGLPVVNWGRQHGDLRVAHFFGMHALQVLPLFAYYIARNRFQLIGFALVYFSLVTYLFIQAIQGIPFI